MRLVLGLDLGTSGTKAYLMSPDGRRAGLGYTALVHHVPRPGWTEHDPRVVAGGAADAIAAALRDAGAAPGDIVAAGIASQRDSDYVWDARTGEPIAPAITWQDLRTAPLVAELDAWEHAGERRRRLGYYPGPWCAALHTGWRTRHQPEWQAAIEGGYARTGMAAGWLLVALGRPHGHVHDFSLVQKTGLWDFRSGRYWPEWRSRLGLDGLPPGALPQPVPTLYPYGTLRVGEADIPVTAMIGDQQAALFGHGCRRSGEAECTHGTASFVDVVAGATAPEMDNLNVYHAWSLPETATGDGQPATSDPETIRHTYCLEADTTVSGAAVRWMHRRAGLLPSEAGIDALVSGVPDSGGVMFVPAFTGLNVPYNDHDARGTILGLTLGSDRAHVVRAFLDALGYQVRAILEAIRAQTGLAVHRLSVGGGLSASDMACQIQADLAGVPVYRPAERETTARGAALLAGLGAGLWPDLDALPPPPDGGTSFEPRTTEAQRDEGFAKWEAAVRSARAFHGKAGDQ